MNPTTDNRIIDLAIKELKKNINISVNIKIDRKNIENKNIIFDGLLILRNKKKRIVFCIELKKTVNKTTIVFLKNKKEKLPHEQILITSYVNDNMAERLKENNIQFIDTAGNTYINNPPIYIYIKGNNKKEILPAPKRIFGPKGLKIIFVLLCNPKLIMEPYRRIATLAEVSLGTVGWVMSDLKETGYLKDMKKRGRKLLKKEDLFYRWCNEYTDRLKPKLFLGRFKGKNDWWQNYKIDLNYAQWGGEVAANKLTQYLKPQKIELYIKEDYLRNIVIENRLSRDNTGNTEIFKRFWSVMESEKRGEAVHPVLVFADLIGTGNQRNMEVAKIIYEKFIDKYIK